MLILRMLIKMLHFLNNQTTKFLQILEFGRNSDADCG